jgi:hypothetical protein
MARCAGAPESDGDAVEQSRFHGECVNQCIDGRFVRYRDTRGIHRPGPYLLVYNAAALASENASLAVLSNTPPRRGAFD